MHYKIGTRSSKLALWQASYVQQRLAAWGHTSELITMETKGDKVLDVTLAKIGSKGLFTEELEQMLLEGTIDVAVHSAKDLPSALPEGLEIVAFSKREQVHDVLLSAQSTFSLTLPGAIVGTSSTRRVAFLRHHYPQVEVRDMRGNLQTRIQKMMDGHCQAIILAYAGVHRMEYDHLIVSHLDTKVFVPPVGQGSIAVQCRESLEPSKKEILRKSVNHEDTEVVLRAERSYLLTMSGGCSIPSFCLASLESSMLHIHAGIISLDGQHKVEVKQEFNIFTPEQAGQEIGIQVLGIGGAQIIQSIKNSLN